MRLAFRERLAGSFEPSGVAGEAGPPAPRPFFLDLCGQAALDLRGSGLAEIPLEGLARLEGIASESPVEGTLTLAAGAARYRLGFASDAGAPIALVGERRPRSGARILGATVMWAELAGPSGPLGRALLRFDLRSELRPFLRSLELRR